MKDKIRYYYMNIAEQLDLTYSLLKKSFGRQIAFSIIFNIIYSILLFIIVFIGVVGVLNLSINSFYFSSPSLSSGFVPLFFIGLFVLFFVLIGRNMRDAGNTIISYNSYIDLNPNLSDVLKECFKNIPRIFTITIIHLLIYALYYLVFILLGIGIFYLLVFNTFYLTTGIIIIYAVIGFLFVLSFLVVDIFVSSILAPSIPVAILERKYFYGAVKRGYELIKPDFWKTVKTLAIYKLIALTVTYSIAVFLALGKSIMGIVLPSNIASGIVLFTVYSDTIINNIVSLAFSPTAGILNTIIYLNQRIKLEGLDIELKLMKINRNNIYSNINYYSN